VNDLLHVVVGAGFPRYFENCISSITSQTRHDVMAIYNYVDEFDFAEVMRVSEKHSDSNVKFEYRPNRPELRTGSLYEAYNLAIDYAVGRYNFVSFTQADMQLMWWDDKILAFCKEAMNDASGRSTQRICFYSQIPVQGKRADYYSIWTANGNHEMPTIPGIVDVGIYPMETIGLTGFRFKGSEKSLATLASQDGWRVMLHPYPFLAPVPFPRTLRDVRSKRSKALNSYGIKPILMVTPKIDKFPDFAVDSFHPFYMEDVVIPNGWLALRPYWPSDTKSSQWMKVRITQRKLFSTPIFQINGVGPVKWFGIIGFFRPGYFAVIRSVVQILWGSISKWAKSR
jgi:hypothetical protein